MLKISLTSLLSLFFIGCGGASQHEPREVKTLYFQPATNGIDYTCGERQGVTKQSITTHGTITCIYAPIKLSLGSLFFGELSSIRNQQNIYPQSLVPSFDGDFNNKEVLKRAILLLSLDDKVSSEYISISKKTKDKISLITLDNLTITQLNQTIIKMGFIPVSQEEARIYLIMHSENTNIGKPLIRPFTEDISGSLMVGSTIGQLSITQGDGTLNYPFKLKGEGAEYFLLNDKGKLILTQSLEKVIDYNLTVTATNEYGYSTQTLNLHREESQKVGKVQLDGLVTNITVNLFKLNNDKSQDFIASTTTNQRGSFDLMTEHLDDHQFYIYEVENNLRLITKGIWIKKAMYKIRITPLSEMLYTYVEELPLKSLEESLHKHAKLLLRKSLDAKQTINANDVIIFDPIYNQEALYPTLTYDNTYQKIRDKIKTKNQSYQNDLFLAYVIDSYQANAIEIVGSTVYSIDMMNSGEFRIYDLETKKLIGKLKLHNTPMEEDTHVIYVNLLDKDVTITSLAYWSYGINIKNQNNPLLLTEPFINYSILSGNFNQIAVGKSLNKNIFSKERSLYFYNKEKNQNQNQIIKSFTLNPDNSTFQYEFNSKFLKINSLWAYKNYLYVIGDNKIHIFQEKNKKMKFSRNYDALKIKGDVLGVEENILYILNQKVLTLLDITDPLKPKFIEKISVPFSYKLGIKTNGAYITTGSEIIDIQALRASKNAT